MSTKCTEADYIEMKGFPKGMIMYLMMVAILSLGHFLNNKFILIVTLTVIIFYYSLININEKIKLLFFLIPWIYILRVESGTRTIFSYLTVILFIAVVFKSKLNFDMRNILYIMTVIIFILFQKFIIAEIINFEEISFIITLLTFGIIRIDGYKSFKWDEIAIAFIFGLFLSIFSGFIINKLPHMLGYFRLTHAVKGQGIGLRFSALHMDPNGFGTQSIFGCIIGVIVINQRQIRFKTSVTLILSVMILFVFIVGFLSSSKAYLLVAVFSIFLYPILLLYEKSVYRSIKFVILFVVAIIIGYSLGWLEPFIIRYTARFSDVSDYTALSSGRNNILQVYFEILISRGWVVLFGTSLEAVGLSNAAHNTIVQAITRLGLISFATIILFLRNIYSTVVKARDNDIKGENLNKNISWLRFMPLLVYSFMGLSLDLLFKNEFLYIVFLGIFIVAWFKPLKVIT